MKWNVYWYDINAKRIVVKNLFKLSNKFNQDLKDLKKYRKLMTRENFNKALKSALTYSFWSKCEHEVFITEPFGHANDNIGEKVDIYGQIMINETRFFDYVWENIEQANIE